jgi:hypothetical protein
MKVLLIFIMRILKRWYFGPMMKALLPLIWARSNGNFFVHVKVNEKGCKPQSRPWPQANDLKILSCCWCALVSTYFFSGCRHPAPPLLLSRRASETHHVVAHMYIILLQGARLSVNGWMDGWMDAWISFSLFLFISFAWWWNLKRRKRGMLKKGRPSYVCRITIKWEIFSGQKIKP